MRRFALLLAAVCLAGPAHAADVAVTVTSATGAALPDAVVMIKAVAEGPGRPARFPWPYVVSQHDIRFDPFVLVVPVGAEVAFPNFDPFRHHVYSFSPAKRFQLKLYGHDETRRVKFDRPGVVALGCNIHDAMSAFIRVVDTPFAAKSGVRGETLIRDVPAGPATITVWHPYLRGPEAVRQIVVPATGPVSLKIAASVGPPPMRHGDY
jgi:plastocyanin